MLEGILYFALGFLASTLLALMAAPIVWQRSAFLAKQRIERSVPLTLNEIQADKDQLRAEFAMSTRRLELSIDELRDKAASQVIEINRKRDEIAKLAEEQHGKLRSIDELQTKGGELRTRLKQREEQLNATTRRLEDVQSKLDEQALQLEEMRQLYDKARNDADSNRIELVAKQTEMENLSDRIESMSFSTADKGRSGTQEDLKAELAKTRAGLQSEKKKLATSKQQNASLTKDLENTTRQLEEAELELSKIRHSAGDEDNTHSELMTQLVEQQSLNVELEAKLAQTSLQIESLLNDASNANVKKAMTGLDEDKAQLAKEVEALKKERDDLAKQIDSIHAKQGEDWDVERRENAILRERINDLAAQVTTMTAAIEGEASPINDILRTADSQDSLAAADPQEDGADAINSLADRIRALQKAGT